MLIQPRLGRSAWKAKHYFFLGIGLLLAIGLVIGAMLGIGAFLLPHEGGGQTDKGRTFIFKARNLKNAEEKVFRLVLPDKVWAADTGMQHRLNASTVWKGVDKDGWFAVATRDYGQARPREAELMRVGIERLEQFFEGGLELSEKPEPATLGQEPGQRLLFKGQINSVTWWGHMYMLAHHGFGYWLYVAAPSAAEADDLFAKDLKAGAYGFFLDTDRKGWREQPPKMESFATENGILTVTLTEGVFEKRQAKDQDERGELHLFAKSQKEKDNRKNDDVLILALEKQGNLKEALAKSPKNIWKTPSGRISKDYKVELKGEGGDDPELGKSEQVGNRPGRIAEGKLLRGETPIRFWIVGVVNAADKVYVIRCECNWENRQIWREEFQELLRSVKFKN